MQHNVNLVGFRDKIKAQKNNGKSIVDVANITHLLIPSLKKNKNIF